MGKDRKVAPVDGKVIDGISSITLEVVSKLLVRSDLWTSSVCVKNSADKGRSKFTHS